MQNENPGTAEQLSIFLRKESYMNGLSCSRGCSEAVPAVPGGDRPSVRLETLIVARLEDAGRVLLALPMRGHSTAMRTGHPEVVHEAIEAYGWQLAAARPAVPSAARISRMDEALGWIALLPEGDRVLRRIVGFRMLVHPVNDRHLYSWRKIGRAMSVDYHTAQRWHGQAIDAIAARLREIFSVSV